MSDVTVGDRVTDSNGRRGAGTITDRWMHRGRPFVRVQWDKHAPGCPRSSVRPAEDFESRKGDDEIDGE